MPISAGIDETDIEHYIAQVEASSVLGRSKRRARLLSHLIRSEYLEQGDRLKAYSIGLDIFGKPTEFDPAADSVVRVEMGRLRSALALFEASEFNDTRIIVDIPVGTYRPTIELREPVAEDISSDAVEERALVYTKIRLFARYLVIPVLAVMAVMLVLWQSLWPPGEAQTIGIQVSVTDTTDKLAIEAKSSLIRALSRTTTFSLLEPKTPNELATGASFKVAISTSNLDEMFAVSIELVDLSSDRLLWSSKLSAETQALLISDVETRSASELRVRLFGASKEILEGLDPEDLSPEALFVLATWVPGVARSAIEWELMRVHYARLALSKDPDFGAAHSVLADKLGYLANVYEPSDNQETYAAALFHSQRAMELSPLDPDVVFNVAQSHWHFGRLSQSRNAMARVLELDPRHDLARFLHLVIPYTCAVAPQQILAEAIDFDQTLSADNPLRWMTLTWIGWLHMFREEWSEALAAEEAAALIFETPYTFMRRAAILNQLDRRGDAIDVINRQSDNWNGFDPRHYARSVVPRLCSESSRPERFIQYYSDLSDAIDGRINN
ncbi:hypothetical protein [Tateyamaria sp. ANG-S1]|uniref:tetratricopeptide repeat protein n=1 Tax=Tateyamaria sp. ANG-S1 TaxID=1577905 RepID=UPI00068BBE43|nr:hypothetical protein [Tateyamaria sp. ANG-S1]